MKKSRLFLIISVVASICLLLASCNKETGCTHEYDNECDNECNLCGEQRAVPHLWHGTGKELCQYKLTCARCGLTMGENVEHNYTDENGNMLEDCLSCGHPNPIAMEKTATLKFNYSYLSVEEATSGEPFAELLLNNGILHSAFGIEIPDERTAGDTVTITYTGKITILESFPATICLEYGEVKSYSFSYAQVIPIAKEDLINDMHTEYNLLNDYVILDRAGKYTTLESYTGEVLYLVENNLNVIQPKSQPEELVDPRLQVACMLAYNPRVLGEIVDISSDF